MAILLRMTLSQELTWRGFVNQTTYKDIAALDGDPITFYWGVDPSADSMTVGNLAIAMMVGHFIKHGHKAILLTGGATGLIGDPDGKAQERDLKSLDEIRHNVAGLTKQYHTIFDGQPFEIVDNYDWFKTIGYLEFLRDVGKHVPMRTMLGRDFVQSRLGDEGAGISYAEFSYSLIQGYDFLHLHREKGVSLQVSGADQWGNCIAGVDLIRRITGDETHIWTAPLIVNKATGVKFGKSEDGAIWLDPTKTTPTQYYQFWVTREDEGIEDYLKIYTLLSPDEIAAIMSQQISQPKEHFAQQRLAQEATALIHGQEAMRQAETVTGLLTGKLPIDQLSDELLTVLRQEIPVISTPASSTILDALVATGLASSLSEARRLLQGNAVSVNSTKVADEELKPEYFVNGRFLLRRGKAFKDSALVERG
ncbi:MAG: tyrS [Candidatus Saccharibacteria bacterium]|nr:tyrS [Candidatus Saccharibacteria bacterium]